MSRITIPTRDDAPAAAKATLDSIYKELGFVPNLHRLMSVSPTVLAGWAALRNALNEALDPATRAGVALAVSEANGCDYCIAAYSYASVNFAHVSPQEGARNRDGRSSDRRRGATLVFAKQLIETRGKVTAADFAAVRAAGFDDAEIVEIVALSAQYALTNFLNNVAQTEIDFPRVTATTRPSSAQIEAGTR